MSEDRREGWITNIPKQPDVNFREPQHPVLYFQMFLHNFIWPTTSPPQIPTPTLQLGFQASQLTWGFRGTLSLLNKSRQIWKNRYPKGQIKYLERSSCICDLRDGQGEQPSRAWVWTDCTQLQRVAGFTSAYLEVSRNKPWNWIVHICFLLSRSPAICSYFIWWVKWKHKLSCD